MSIQRHASCLQLCMNHAFQSRSSSHTEDSREFCAIYDIHRSLKAAIATAPAEKQQDYLEVLSEFLKNYWDYIAHPQRTKHQGDYYR